MMFPVGASLFSFYKITILHPARVYGKMAIRYYFLWLWWCPFVYCATQWGFCSYCFCIGIMCNLQFVSSACPTTISKRRSRLASSCAHMAGLAVNECPWIPHFRVGHHIDAQKYSVLQQYTHGHCNTPVSPFDRQIIQRKINMLHKQHGPRTTEPCPSHHPHYKCSILLHKLEILLH